MSDVIDILAGIERGTPLDTARDNRPEARKHAQASYDALFEPREFGGVSAIERFAVAAFVAGLHGRPETRDYYDARLAESGASKGLIAAVKAELAVARTRGPYGNYPAGPLAQENLGGPLYVVGKKEREALGPRLTAAFHHTHMLVFHPRDAAPASLQELLDASWSPTDIVVLSQLVSFLSYQIRVVAGLRVLVGPS